MLAYVDHNFLINCVNRPKWREHAIGAGRSGEVSLVVSPWSIYEIGTTSRSRMDELITLVEELQPRWILERVDLQLCEFLHSWSDFWNGTRTQFNPIGTLVEIHASFFRKSPEQIQSYSLRDYAAVWQRPEAAQDTTPAFKKQAEISAWNRRAYAQGRLTALTIRDIRMRYIARQFTIARAWKLPQEKVHEREERILKSPKASTYIKFFVEFGGMEDMKAQRVEEALTLRQWDTAAVLNPNRILDRFHATVALPYCDLFVTSDKELVRKSNAIRGELSFEIAQVKTGEQFIDFLRGQR